MMCCSDPDSVVPVDDADRTIWLCAGDLSGWHQSSPVGWAMVRSGGDCDGLDEDPDLDFSAVDDIRISWDGVRLFGDTDFRTVEIRTGTGRPLGRLSSGPAITLDGVNYTDTPPVLRPIAPEKIAAARKAIDAITARAKGLAGNEWPPMWVTSEQGGYRWRHSTVVEQAEDVGFLSVRVPDTERGRRAAWELEGA